MQCPVRIDHTFNQNKRGQTDDEALMPYIRDSSQHQHLY